MAPGGVEGADDNEVGVLLTEEYVMQEINDPRRKRQFFVDLRKHATGNATITSYRREKSWFASALVRLYDASLDWMLVHGRKLNKDTLDAAVLDIPVFVALFAEIGKSEIPRDEAHFEARVGELCAKQDEIIIHYREQARSSSAKHLRQYTEADMTNDDLKQASRRVVLNKVMSDVKLVPAFRFRNCSPACDECRANVDKAVDWLERNQRKTVPKTAKEFSPAIRDLRYSTAAHFDRLRGFVPIKRGHLVNCEPCYLYLIIKTCGTQWAGQWLVGADATADKHGPLGRADPAELDLKSGQYMMDALRAAFNPGGVVKGVVELQEVEGKKKRRRPASQVPRKP
jgi:hypothetical protein